MPIRVFPGIDEPLGAVLGHRDVAGISRLLLLRSGDVPGRSFHIAAHWVSGDYRPVEGWGFTQPERHDHDEFNVLLPAAGPFRYRYEADGEVSLVEGPCTVFIPARTSHRMEPVAGTGIFLCIQLSLPPGAG